MRFYFIFLPVVLVSLYSIPGVFCLSGGGDSFVFILFFYFLKENKHPRSESNPAFQSAREILARFSRGFIHALVTTAGFVADQLM